jgi:hypothetical protein
MSKKVTIDESYLDELLLTIQSQRADLWFIARLFDRKNGIVTREDFEQALKERKDRHQQK